MQAFRGTQDRRHLNSPLSSPALKPKGSPFRCMQKSPMHKPLPYPMERLKGLTSMEDLPSMEKGVPGGEGYAKAIQQVCAPLF